MQGFLENRSQENLAREMDQQVQGACHVPGTPTNQHHGTTLGQGWGGGHHIHVTEGWMTSAQSRTARGRLRGPGRQDSGL